MQLPAEYAPQSGVLLTWPHAATDWRDCLEAANTTYIDLARAITRHTHLLIICHDASHRDDVGRVLSRAGLDRRRTRFAVAPTNDTWVRDYGPLGVNAPDGPRLLDFTFNGWGNKYAASQDNAVSRALHADGAFGRIALETHTLVLEGGSIDVDGRGTLLTTTRCLLDSGRNPGENRASLERHFGELLGVERVLWLEHGGLDGDDTDGHVDMLARFCDEATLAYTQCRDTADSQYAELAAMERQLQAFRDRHGCPYRLVALPLPRPILDADCRRLPASYANFLVINGAVLVPVYDDPADSVACERLAACFPGREVIALNCLTLIRQYGSLHCATMQLPEGVLDTEYARK